MSKFLFVIGIVITLFSCGTVKMEYQNKYIYHPYELESCTRGQRCILVKGVYEIERSIQLLDKRDIQYEGSGSTILMSEKAPVKNGYSIFNVRDGQDLKFTGFTLDGNKQKRKCAEQYAHTFIMVGSKNVGLTNVNIKNSPVDGFYLGAGSEGDSSTYCRNILIENCRIDSSCRNGISIINAYGVKIRSVEISHSKGLGPAARIDVESDATKPIPSNREIVIENSKFFDHEGCGIMTSQKGTPERIEILNNVVSRCQIGVFVASTKTKISGNSIVDSRLFGIQSVRYDNAPIDKNVVENNSIESAEIGIHYSGEDGYIKNNKIGRCSKTGIWLNGNTVNITSVTLTSNQINWVGEAGIYANNFATTRVHGNQIFDCKKEGISIVNGASVVDSNIITRCSTGAIITGSKCDFTNNQVSDCTTGLSAIGGNRIKLGGRIERNKFSVVRNTWYGDVHQFDMKENTIEK